MATTLLSTGMSDAVAPNPLITPFPAVNSFTLGQFPMPGKWTLLSADKEFGWQQQQGFGLSGAVVFPKGDPLVVAKFKGEFWAASDYAIFLPIREQILKKPLLSMGAGPLSLAAPLPVDHPELRAMGITQVVLLKTTPVIQEEGGLWTISLELLQYRPPANAPPKPKTVIPDTKPPVPTAQSQYEIEMQKLGAEIEAQKALLK